jgi:putative ABC transport system permease protein
MSDFREDIRYSLRGLRRNPVYALVAVLTLALGIGANTAVFSVVNGILLKPLAYDDPQRVALLWTAFGPDLPQNWVSGPEFTEMREFATQFEDIAVVVPTTLGLTGSGEPEQITAAAGSGALFRVLRVDAAQGRLFGPDDDRLGADRVVVLGDGFWRRRFGADPAIVGRTVNLSGQAYTVIGIMPAGFKLYHPEAQVPPVVDVWAPLVPVLGTDYPGLNRGSHFLRAFARLKPGVTLAQAQEDMARAASLIRERSPDYYDFDGWGITVISLHGDLVNDVKPALVILLGAVGFVLLIACVNVANLQLARAAAREREIAVRSALGASGRRLVRQLLTESTVLAAIGAVVGLGLAFGLIQLLGAIAPPGLPRRDEIGIDASVLAFTGLAALVTGVLFGLVPALYGTRESLVESLKEGGRGSSGGRGGKRIRMGLVVTEVALALVLLVGAGLMLKSFGRLLRSDPGYATDDLLTLRIALPGAKYDSTHKIVSFYDRLLERVAVLPGVASAGVISHLPLSASYASGTTIVNESRTVQAEGNFPYAGIEADRRWVSPEYFRTMGVQVVRGRAFTPADDINAPLVALVDEEFVRRFWPGEEPLGKRVAIGGFGSPEGPAWREVIGVVRHSRHYSLNSVGREQVYLAYRQGGPGTMYLALRAAGDPLGLTGQVRNEVWTIDPDQPVSDISSMEQRVSGAVSQPQFNLVLLATFASIALALAAVGIYGVMSYAVALRTPELGIRMALGATQREVRGLVVRQGMALVAGGAAIGLGAALGLSRVLRALLYDVSPADPLTYLGVALLLGGVALLASFIPAARATRIQPIAVLRNE